MAAFAGLADSGSATVHEAAHRTRRGHGRPVNCRSAAWKSRRACSARGCVSGSRAGRIWFRRRRFYRGRTDLELAVRRDGRPRASICTHSDVEQYRSGCTILIRAISGRRSALSVDRGTRLPKHRRSPSRTGHRTPRSPSHDALGTRESIASTCVSLPLARGDLGEELERVEPLRRHRDHTVDGLQRSADHDRGIAVEHALEFSVRRRSDDDV